VRLAALANPVSPTMQTDATKKRFNGFNSLIVIDGKDLHDHSTLFAQTLLVRPPGKSDCLPRRQCETIFRPTKRVSAKLNIEGQGAMRPQERAAGYPVVAAWSAFLHLIGAGAFVLGMAIQATAKPPAPRPEPIYYCATGRRDSAVRALQGPEGSEGYLMTAANQIFLVMDAGSLKAAFTTRRELTTYLRCRHDTFTNPLVYTLGGEDGYTPSVMTMTAALADR
jgi:hypothetical protein